MNRYFCWSDMSEIKKIRFAMMKLTGQAKQYWKNLERIMRCRREDPVETWECMKEKLRLKYVQLFFSQQFLDKWNGLTHGNKSATGYITKFVEYLNQRGAVEFESPEQTYLGFGLDLGVNTVESSFLEALRS